MGDKIYLDKDNIFAVAADTEFTVEELIDLMTQEPDARWVVKVSGIQKEVGYGATTDLIDYTREDL